MMKLGTAWYGFRDYSMMNYFETAAALGLPRVEMPIYYHMMEEDPMHKRGYSYRSVEQVEGVRLLAEKSGIQMVSAVSENPVSRTVAGRGTIDRSLIEFGLACSRRAVDICAALGIPVLRVTEPSVYPEYIHEAEERMKECGQALIPLGAYAADKGVVLVVENYGLTSQQMIWILEESDHPNIGTLYDPCNYYRIGEDPLDALKVLREKVFYCHLKDAFIAEEREPDSLFEGSRWPPSVAVGEGEIDWKPILTELSGFYNGTLCFEYEMHRDVVRGIRVSRDHVLGLLGASE